MTLSQVTLLTKLNFSPKQYPIFNYVIRCVCRSAKTLQQNFFCLTNVQKQTLLFFN